MITTNRPIVVGAATAAVLVARLALSRFEAIGGHLGEPYSRHPWLMLLDLATPFLYFVVVFGAVAAAQKLVRGRRMSSLIVALSTWALTCSFLVSLTNDRMIRTIRWGFNERVWQMRSEDALAYADRVELYLLGGFTVFAAVGATIGVAIASGQRAEAQR